MQGLCIDVAFVNNTSIQPAKCLTEIKDVFQWGVLAKIGAAHEKTDVTRDNSAIHLLQFFMNNKSLKDLMNDRLVLGQFFTGRYDLTVYVARSCKNPEFVSHSFH